MYIYTYLYITYYYITCTYNTKSFFKFYLKKITAKGKDNNNTLQLQVEKVVHTNLSMWGSPFFLL